MNLEFEHRKGYGHDRFYPINDEAIFIAELMKVASMTLDTLKKMKQFGWEVKIIYQPFEL